MKIRSFEPRSVVALGVLTLSVLVLVAGNHSAFSLAARVREIRDR